MTGAMDMELPQSIQFESHFFASIHDVAFIRDDLSKQNLMRMTLNGAQAKLPIEGLKKELKLKNDAADAMMLDVIEKSLKYVPVIKIGDSVPTELKTGKASWEISDKHRALAQGRLSMQLVSWMSGDEAVVVDATQLDMIADDPTMKAKINEAFTQAAQKLGIPPENKEQVIDLVNQLAEELSYIEALRTEFQFITVVEERIAKLAEIYRSDRAMAETITQVQKLCSIPMSEFRLKFDEMDAQTGEIISVLKNLGAQIQFIRDARDELFQRFWAWRTISERWAQQPAKRSRDCESLLQETYRFLAQRHLPQKEWELFSKAQEAMFKKSTESVWGG